MKLVSTEGVLDVVQMMSEHDTIVMLPTLGHALEWWRIYRTAITELHGGKDYVVHTKTSVTSRLTHTALRLWVPYEPDPTMPMDQKQFRGHYDYVSPYYTRREIRWLA